MKFIQENKYRRVIRVCLAMTIAFVFCEYFKVLALPFVLLATLIVMLTSTGSAFYQGLLRFFALLAVVILVSWLFGQKTLIFQRIVFVCIGALIGVISNVLILPDRVDVQFRLTVIPVLKAYSIYFSGIITLMLEHDKSAAENGKAIVEKALQSLPAWVYEAGFDIRLQKGYRYYLMKLSQMSDILFAMHYIAHYDFDSYLLAEVKASLQECVNKAEKFISSLIIVLDLKKLTEGVVDFSDDINAISESFKKTSPLSLELLDVEKKNVYFAEFIYYLKEWHDSMVKLAKALR